MPEKSTVFHGIYGFLSGEMRLFLALVSFLIGAGNEEGPESGKKRLRFSTNGL